MKLLNREFIEKFKINSHTISATKFWIISLRPAQPTIGSLVLTLNRDCPTMSALTPKEAEDLSAAFNDVEVLLKKTFGAEKINYLALMMIDEQVHFHIIPRYSKPVELGGQFYEDTAWPGPPTLDPLDVNGTQMTLLLNTLRNKTNS